MRRNALSGRLIGALATTLLLCGFTDHVSVEIPSGQSAWLLVDGPERSPDDVAMAAGPSMEVGPFGVGRGEITLFPSQSAGAVRVIPVDWTDGEDAMGIAPAPRVDIPVTFWILHAPEGESAARVDIANSLLMTGSIFECEHVGIRISDARINYMPLEYETRGDVLDFTCGAKDEILEVGWDAGRLNVYVVSRVSVNNVPSPTNGQACSVASGVVILGYEAAPHLLAHEIGHNLGLTHPPLGVSWADRNVMVGSSNLRSYLTEGQIFRVHLSPYSLLNYTEMIGGEALRDSQAEGTRVCTVDVADSVPALGLQLRADEQSVPCTTSRINVSDEVRQHALRLKKRLPVGSFRPRWTPPPPDPDGPLPGDIRN